jgi:hypothetical protein
VATAHGALALDSLRAPCFRSAVRTVVRWLLWLTLLGIGSGCDVGGGSPSEAERLRRARDAAPTGGDWADTGPLDAGLPWPEVTPLPDGGTGYAVEIGITDPETGADYLPLEPGGDIPIGGVGQAGLTARLAVRVTPPGGEAALPEATVDLVLTNVATGVMGENRNYGFPVMLHCGGGDDDGACDVAPVLVEITHLAKLPELEGLRVQVDAVVRHPEDQERVLARDRRRGVLQQL